MFKCIYRGYRHINTKLSAQTLSYKMKNNVRGGGGRMISWHKRLCKSPMENSADLRKPFLRLAEKDIKPVRLWSNSVSSVEKDAIRSPSVAAQREEERNTKGCHGMLPWWHHLISSPFLFLISRCNWPRRLQRSRQQAPPTCGEFGERRPGVHQICRQPHLECHHRWCGWVRI